MRFATIYPICAPSENRAQGDSFVADFVNLHAKRERGKISMWRHLAE